MMWSDFMWSDYSSMGMDVDVLPLDMCIESEGSGFMFVCEDDVLEFQMYNSSTTCTDSDSMTVIQSGVMDGMTCTDGSVGICVETVAYMWPCDEESPIEDDLCTYMCLIPTVFENDGDESCSTMCSCWDSMYCSEFGFMSKQDCLNQMGEDEEDGCGMTTTSTTEEPVTPTGEDDDDDDDDTGMDIDFIPGCDDDNGSMDELDNDCSYYYSNIDNCGSYDNDDFSAFSQCCACNTDVNTVTFSMEFQETCEEITLQEEVIEAAIASVLSVQSNQVMLDTDSCSDVSRRRLAVETDVTVVTSEDEQDAVLAAVQDDDFASDVSAIAPVTVNSASDASANTVSPFTSFDTTADGAMEIEFIEDDPYTTDTMVIMIPAGETYYFVADLTDLTFDDEQDALIVRADDSVALEDDIVVKIMKDDVDGDVVGEATWAPGDETYSDAWECDLEKTQYFISMKNEADVAQGMTFTVPIYDSGICGLEDLLENLIWLWILIGVCCCCCCVGCISFFIGGSIWCLCEICGCCEKEDPIGVQSEVAMADAYGGDYNY